MAPQLGPQVIFDFGTLTTGGEEGASGGFSTVLTGSGQMPGFHFGGGIHAGCRMQSISLG